MVSQTDVVDTILVVDDEDNVRRTIQDWLESADLGCQILVAADPSTALQFANENPNIDLAILDWNLGEGTNGLALLRDLRSFCDHIIAIMVTGYAHQATPLDAMRMGVRDYFDKDQDFNRTTFLEAVKRQLDLIRPAKRERQIEQQLHRFHSSLEKILPLVQTSSALNDLAPSPDVVERLLQLLIQTTRASDGLLLVHSYDPQGDPASLFHLYDRTGQRLADPETPFAESLAGSIVSRQEPCILHELDAIESEGLLELQAFERGRKSLLAVPLDVTPQMQAVLELFDKQGGEEFSEADRQQAANIGTFATEMLRQALAQKQNQQILFDTIETALEASNSLSASLTEGASGLDSPPPREVLDSLRKSWEAVPSRTVEAEDSLQLAEAIRVLHVRHGPPALVHCLRLVESLRTLLDEVTDL